MSRVTLETAKIRAEAKRSRSEAALNRAASIKADGDAKLATAKSALEAHGKEIAARIQIADKALAELKDKAGPALKSFVDHRHAIAKMLADAADECKAAKVPFEEFRKKYAPNFQRSLTYELVAIGHGKLTLEDRTADATKRKQKSRAAAKVRSAAEPPHTDAVVRGANGKPIDTSGFAGPAKVQLEAELARNVSTVVEPGIPEPPAEPVVEPVVEPVAPRVLSAQPSEWHYADGRRVTLEDFLGEAMKAEKSQFPAHAICVRCIEYLAPLMNEGTRAQLRKDITAITTRADKAERKAA